MTTSPCGHGTARFATTDGNEIPIVVRGHDNGFGTTTPPIVWCNKGCGWVPVPGQHAILADLLIRPQNDRVNMVSY